MPIQHLYMTTFKLKLLGQTAVCNNCNESQGMAKKRTSNPRVHAQMYDSSTVVVSCHTKFCVFVILKISTSMYLK